MPSRNLIGAFALLTAVPLLVACNDISSLTTTAAPTETSSADDAAAVHQKPDGQLLANVPRGTNDVSVDTVVRVSAQNARLTSVAISSAAGGVEGALRQEGVKWVASDRLEPGQTYTVTAKGEGASGKHIRLVRRFTTQALTLDEQTYPSVAPLDGETVGVGMPVVVSFDLPVTDQAGFERHMTVTTKPEQRGSWHWFSATRARWRPAGYWQPGTTVSVSLDVNGLAAGNGIYGQEDRDVDFTVGAAHIYKVNAETHQMKVLSNGELLRTLPVTTGKPGFTTRSGTKVIMEKFASKRMNSETVGIPSGSAEAYDLDNVQWAMRVTSSGEFVHAAPWSTGSQGIANVSHGCTGLSTADAAWLYAMSRRGDVVEYVGTDRPMTLDNGYGDWNATFQSYAKGSALP